MNESLEAVTTQALAVALDVSAMRHQVLALNIANANTSGYVPQRLSFDAHLEAAARDIQSRGSIDPQILRATTMRLEPVLDAQGHARPVHLDSEMAEVARNAVHYQALVKGLSRHLSILASAAGDGRK